MTYEEAYKIATSANPLMEGAYSEHKGEYIKLIIEALENKIPKKPSKDKSDEYAALCPYCYSSSTHWIHGGLSYCEYCGQAFSLEVEKQAISERTSDDYIIPHNSDHRKQRGRTAPNWEDDLK